MLSRINLPLGVVDREMEAILTPVKLGESGLVICYPACQQDFNLVRFLTYKKRLKKILGKYHNRFAFLLIHLNPLDDQKSFTDKFRSAAKTYAKNVSPADDLKPICQKILNKGQDPYLFLFNAHSVQSDVFNDIALSIHELILTANRFGAQIFYEGDIYKQDFIKTLSSNNKFLRNVFIIPTYSLDETKWYLRSLSKEWQMKLPDKKIAEITRYCVGYLWVLREIVRLIKVNKNDHILEILAMPSVRLRIEAITSMIEEKEKLALIDLLGKKPNEKAERANSYLFQTGIIVNQGGRYILPLQPMAKLLSKAKMVNEFHLDRQQNVIYKNKNLNVEFGGGELRVVKLLLSRKGRLVSRDEIAQAIWENDYLERYSEWAIDKLISRIRSVLMRLGLPKGIIRTKKGQGFILSS